MSATVDVAIRFGYLADGYHGVQIQPDVRTVQAELERALRRRSWLGRNEHIALSSRTDAGVRVVMNGARLRLAEDIWATVGPNRMRLALQEGTAADLHVHDLMLAPEGWRPRYASHRTYRYRMEMLEHWTSIPLQDQTFERILMMFEGRHDFTNFARLEEGNDPIRRVLHCRPWVANGRIVGFEIRGEAFLWNMIRRIAAAVDGILRHRWSEAHVHRALHRPHDAVDMGVADAGPLLLWGVTWPDLPQMSTDPKLLFSSNGTEAWQPWRLRAERELDLLVIDAWADLHPA